MATERARKIFVNLAVRDLKRAKEFFARLGFEFNPKFTDDNAACMIINEDAFVMLLTESYFKTFIKKPISEASTRTEALYALSCKSRDEVKQLVEQAIAAGGSHAADPQDHGFMVAWSFYDLDGHHWELVWMDPAAV